MSEDYNLIKCVGCGKTAKEVGYNKDDPVEEDGTYADHKFICDSCYGELIDIGQDIGSPLELQLRVLKLKEA